MTQTIRNGHRVSRRPAPVGAGNEPTQELPVVPQRRGRYVGRPESPLSMVLAMLAVFAVLFVVAAGCGVLL